MRFAGILTLLAAPLLLGAAAPAVRFADHAGTFDRVAMRTRGMESEARIAAVRAEFDRRVPGLYTDRDAKRIVEALEGYPKIRTAYRAVERRFGRELAGAVRGFRAIFPDFVPPLPIWLVHSLGIRDGGSDYVAGRKVMMFGADVIARIHNDNSLQPFLNHELFHLEHARHFDDCDQLWCPLWQEGLATYAASAMTPGATDHQLLLDLPTPIRPATDARWGEALCWISTRFDSAQSGDADAAFTGGKRPGELPSRFGYYVGMRIAAEAAKRRPLPALARLDDEGARPVVAAALGSLIAAAKAPCDAPAATGPITHEASRPA